MTDSQRCRELDVPNYAEIKWLLHRNYRLGEVTDFCGFPDASADGFSA
jgi:hypothetical protein